MKKCFEGFNHQKRGKEKKTKQTNGHFGYIKKTLGKKH
jgi:hypothetical protein